MLAFAIPATTQYLSVPEFCPAAASHRSCSALSDGTSATDGFTSSFCSREFFCIRNPDVTSCHLRLLLQLPSLDSRLLLAVSATRLLTMLQTPLVILSGVKTF